MGTTLVMVSFFGKKISKSIKVVRCICMFELALMVSEILMFQICYFQKVGQGHEYIFSQCRCSMANVKIYKSRLMHFHASLTVSDILTFQFCYLQKVG